MTAEVEQADLVGAYVWGGFEVDGIAYDERATWARRIFDLVDEHECTSYGRPCGPDCCDFDLGCGDDDRDIACVLDDLPADGELGSARAHRWRTGDPVYSGWCAVIGWAVATWVMRALGVIALCGIAFFADQVVVRGAARHIFRRGGR